MPFLSISATRGPRRIVPPTVQAYSGDLTLLQIAQSVLKEHASELVRAEARDKLESQDAHILHGDGLRITVNELRELGSRTINLCLEVNAARQYESEAVGLCLGPLISLYRSLIVSLLRCLILTLSHSCGFFRYLTRTVDAGGLRTSTSQTSLCCCADEGCSTRELPLAMQLCQW